MKQNIIIIDSDEKEGKDFKNGVEAGTGQDWKLLVKNSNDRSSKFANFIRYMKYALVPLGVFIRRKKYDSIITWQQFYGLFFAFYCRLFRVKKVNTLVVMTFIYKEKKGICGKIYRKFFDYVVHSKYIDCYTCVANVECENYSRIFHLPKQKFEYVQWGLADFSSEYKIGNEGYVFSAGRSNRDWPFIFAALGNTQYKGIMVCSEGNYRGKYSNLEVVSNISDEEYYNILSQAHCVVISIKDCSISAGQITLIQAMQFGKPVILTQSDGLTNDYVLNEENGLIVPKDKRALNATIDRIFKDKKLYRKLSMNGRKLFEEKFSNYRLGNDIGKIVMEVKK